MFIREINLKGLIGFRVSRGINLLRVPNNLFPLTSLRIIHQTFHLQSTLYFHCLVYQFLAFVA